MHPKANLKTLDLKNLFPNLTALLILDSLGADMMPDALQHQPHCHPPTSSSYYFVFYSCNILSWLLICLYLVRHLLCYVSIALEFHL